jgi:hypothetical protein
VRRSFVRSLIHLPFSSLPYSDTPRRTKSLKIHPVRRSHTLHFLLSWVPVASPKSGTLVLVATSHIHGLPPHLFLSFSFIALLALSPSPLHTNASHSHAIPLIPCLYHYPNANCFGPPTHSESLLWARRNLATQSIHSFLVRRLNKFSHS